MSAKSGRTQFVILCEDRNHYNFARGLGAGRLKSDVGGRESDKDTS